MLTICCVNAGNYLGRGAEYVNKLFDMVRRNLPPGLEGQFVCFTDEITAFEPGARYRSLDPDAERDEAVDRQMNDRLGYHGNIVLRPLPEPYLAGWWNKLALFKQDVFSEDDTVIYFDLDTLICGPLDQLVGWATEDLPADNLVGLADFMDDDKFQSAVMVWKPGESTWQIWDTWIEAGKPLLTGGDQEWIDETYGIDLTLQEVLPDFIESYKVSGGKIPRHASIVCFHGKPRPHEVEDWAAEVWKIGGLSRGQLDMICNTEDDHIKAHVAANVQRRGVVQRLQWAEPHDSIMVIVGGGPSAAGMIDRIKLLQEDGCVVWALNGAANMLIGCGIVPDATVIADARPENSRFICPGQPLFLASQCDPKLFEYAMLWDHRVTMFHLDDERTNELLYNEAEEVVPLIGGGSTVGLIAMSIAYVLGYRTVHLYGYDSSFRVAKHHHAYPQPENDGQMVVETMLENGEKFLSAPWMVHQARQFIDHSQDLAHKGMTFIVAGEGLLPEIARGIMENPTFRSAGIRAQEVVKRLRSQRRTVLSFMGEEIEFDQEPIRGVEVGVFQGEMSGYILEMDARVRLTLVDAYDSDIYLDRNDFHATLGAEGQAAARKVAHEALDRYNGRVRWVEAPSVIAADMIDDQSQDFVFIDADHAAESVARDILAWWPKVKSGGWLCGHDYGNKRPGFGVNKAVDVFVKENRLDLELGENFTWFVRVP